MTCRSDEPLAHHLHGRIKYINLEYRLDCGLGNPSQRLGYVLCMYMANPSDPGCSPVRDSSS